MFLVDSIEEIMEVVEIVVISFLFWNCSLPCLDDFRPRLTKEPVLHWALNHTVDCYRVCLFGRLYALLIVAALALRWTNNGLRLLPTIMLAVGAFISSICNWDAALYFLLLLSMDIAIICCQS